MFVLKDTLDALLWWETGDDFLGQGVLAVEVAIVLEELGGGYL